jgi:hypothetical protein
MLARLFNLFSTRRITPFTEQGTNEKPIRIYSHIGPHTKFNGTRIFYATLSGRDCSFLNIKSRIQHDLGKEHPQEAAEAITALRAHLLESPMYERYLVVKTAHYAGVFTLAENEDIRTLVVEML